jgi:hypothetical protein
MIYTFVLAKTEWFTPVSEVHVGKPFGLLSDLEWVHELHLRPIDFELDAKKMIMDNFSSAHQDVTEFSWLFIIVKLSLNNIMSTLVLSSWGDKQMRQLIDN